MESPPDLFAHFKIPYRTILVSIVFFMLGTYFLIDGIYDSLHGPDTNKQPKKNAFGEEAKEVQPYEKILLGLLLFIPGSYHTAIAILACFGLDGYTYD